MKKWSCFKLILMSSRPSGSDRTDVITKVLVEEAGLNAAIAEKIFRYFVLAALCFFLGLFLWLEIGGKPAGLSVQNFWLLFLLQTFIFALCRFLPEQNFFSLPALIGGGFFFGLFTAPYLYFLDDEFGFYLVGKGLLITVLLFAALAILGWLKTDFMFRFSKLSKYCFLVIFFLAFVSNFLPWNEEGETVFGFFTLVFLAFLTVFDFQKLRFYPRRAAISAASHIFSGLVFFFVIVLRFLTSLQF